MYKRNVNAEGATLDAKAIFTILQILENGSMVDAVRSNLSEKKKIKDLFLVVIRAINIEENRATVASLVQFVSNLCYGQGMFRRMLATESHSEFIKTLKEILLSVKDVQTNEGRLSMDTTPDQIHKMEQDRILLKGTMLNFLGNLSVDATLRQSLAQDVGGLLSAVGTMFTDDVKNKRFDWVESAVREMHVICNCSIETAAAELLARQGQVATVSSIFKTLKLKPESKDERDLICRCL